jgi:outer membrane protein insertion porin family/translocation and assembly module TamA
LLLPLRPFFVAWFVALALALGGCTSIPAGRSSIDEVNIAGGSSIEESVVADKIATTPTEKFFGLFRGIVYDYEVYDPSVVQRDLARIERYYRGKGFLEVHARAGRVADISPGHVRVDIVVQEGPAVLNRALRINGLAELPAPIADDVQDAAKKALPVGTRFDEDAYKGAQASVLSVLTDRGYAYATQKWDATIDLGAHVVDYVCTLTPGPLAKFGAITITGLDPDGDGPRPQEISEAPLRRAINITPGDDYSTAAITEATQALLDLEVFTAVTITPQLTEPPPPNPVVPLTVRLEPTRLREVRLGGGGEFDEIKTEVHLLASWEDHNFLGGLRDLTITFRPGMVLYPTRVGNYVVPTNPLLAERFKVQLLQPGFLEAHTRGFFKPEFNIYPLLVTTNPLPGAPVVGYIEGKGAVGVDRPFGKRLQVTLAYNVQIEKAINYYQESPTDLEELGTLFIAYPELITTLDFRDNAKEPHKGIYLGNNLQSAGGPFGGGVADVKVQPEVRTYIPLGRRVTFATRASVGFLFARNYAKNFEAELKNFEANPVVTDTYVQDLEKMYFRGFFSGGPNTNRGFPIRGVAPYGDVPFLNPSTAAQQVANNCLQAGSNTVVSAGCTSPIGGFSLWELSNEVRVAVSGPFSAAAFCDMGDVSPNQLQIRVKPLRPHLSCGVGARYDTPVGPIRLDIGYRIEGLQVLGYKNDVAANRADSTEGVVPRLFTLPLAIAFGIGEAY